MEKCGLVLEGGGMKGIYTAGVLEYFMENDLYFEKLLWSICRGRVICAAIYPNKKTCLTESRLIT